MGSVSCMRAAKPGGCFPSSKPCNHTTHLKQRKERYERERAWFISFGGVPRKESKQALGSGRRASWVLSLFVGGDPLAPTHLARGHCRGCRGGCRRCVLLVVAPKELENCSFDATRILLARHSCLAPVVGAKDFLPGKSAAFKNRFPSGVA